MSSSSPEVLLFIATGCQHCPSVMQSLTELIKAGRLGKLEIINLQQQPALAEQYNVRSVPWIKIGPFELTGLRSKTELEQWIQRLDEPAAMADYFAELMTCGEMNKIHALLEQNPQYFPLLFDLMAAPDTSLSVRIGVGAVIEEFSGTELLINNIEKLAAYTQHTAARVRNDACHYLGLSQSEMARQYLEPLLNDSDPEVREVAEEALEELN